MRLTIVAGLIVGVSLGFQSMQAVRSEAKVTHAVSAVRVQVSAPRHIAMNARHGATTSGISRDSVAS